MSGFPSNPGLHEQIGLWSLTVHSALGPHQQGSLHVPWIQAFSDGHSESDTQPPIFVSAGIILHVPDPLDIYPFGHTQIIVLTGSELTTWQPAGMLHGFSSPHGSLHFPLKQAKSAGQSPSTLHSVRTCCLHVTYGFPTIPSSHRQSAKWLCTWHSALEAQGCSYTQGLIHCPFIHARSSGQSLLLRQPTTKHLSLGLPRYPDKQRHSALFSTG